MTLQRFTKRFRPSFEAPFCWQALSFLCRKLETDLSAHARLEQETLYALLKA
jgi:iron-sulfur cluster repair protein YtfE (RIC family)